jgi:hypothetical protein
MGRSPRGPSGAADGQAPYRIRTLAPVRRAGESPCPPRARRWRGLAPGVRGLALAAALALLPGVVVPAPVPASADTTPALAAVPERFEAASDGSTVRLTWSAPPGSPVVGFQLLRALQRDGPYAPINPWLIPTAPSGTYTFADLAVDPGATYHYQLEAVDAAGHKLVRGPLSIAVMPEESSVLGPPAGGGYPAPGPAPRGAEGGGGCTEAPTGRWRDAAGLVLLLAAAAIRLRRRSARLALRPPAG